MKNKEQKTRTSNLQRHTVKRRAVDEVIIRAVKKDASITTKVRVRPVVKSVNVAVTSGPGVLGLVPSDQSRVLDVSPAGWPNNVPWKPRRYFGPFWEGSDLHEIEIYISGSNVSWYCNDYFANCPDAARYQPFYPGQNLPTQGTPAVPMVPGYMPASDGAGHFVCFLDRVAYSSRYGGTVELTFRGRYDVGLEVRSGAYVWDLKDLELRIYVTPTAQGLQNPGIAYSQGTVTCEILSREQICYSVPTQGSYTNPGTPFQALNDVHQAELTQALGLLSQEVGKDIASDARRFVGGFLWALFPELLGPGRIVEGINISDDFIELYTRQGIPVVAVNFRARDVHSHGADTFTADEHRLTLDSVHVYNGGIVYGPSKTYETEYGDDTSWVTAGQWNLLTEVPNLGSIVLRISGVEMDWPDADDEFETYETEFRLDEAELLAAHNAQQYGLIEEFTRFALQDFLDSNWLMFFDVDVRVTLGVR